MALKTILVPVEPTPVGRSTLSTAFVIARSTAAHVVGLHLETPPTERAVIHHLSHAAVGLRSAAMQRIVDSDRAEDGKRAESLFDDVAAEAAAPRLDAPARQAGMTAEFMNITGGVDMIAAQARVFDLVVVTQPRDDPEHHLREVLRAVLFEGGRPILVAPTKPPATVGERVMIAWDRSALSARAAALARHLFAGAGRVGILSVASGHSAPRHGPGAHDLARRLAWHGHAPEVVEAEHGHGHLGDVILAEAGRFGADVLVMGAYAHSPFRESLTRGVTNHVLSHADIPLLMTA